MKSNICEAFILLMAFVFISGCKKESTEYQYLSSEIKEWSVYQPGSYWIYKNEVTGLIDSSYIKSQPEVRFDWIQVTDRYAIAQEEIRYVVSGSFLQVLYIDQSGSWEQFYNQSGHKNYGLLWYIKGEGFHKTEKIQNFQINDTSYSNVLHSVYNVSTDTSFVESWIVKNVGVIKYLKRIGNIDTTWTLMRYHSVQ
jgi:hypothetical protein